MCKISDFSSVFEIAFGLGAVFYYLEMRESAEARLDEALTLNEVARTEADEKWRDNLVESIMANGYEIGDDGKLYRIQGGILSMAPSSDAKKKLMHDLKLRWQTGVARVGHLFRVSSILKHSPKITHFLALLSTAMSLGALIWSGFNPDMQFTCSIMSLMLVAAYSNVSWILFWYQFVLPRLIRRRGNLPGPATS